MEGTGCEDVLLLCVSPSRSDGALASCLGHSTDELQKCGISQCGIQGVFVTKMCIGGLKALSFLRG